MEGSHVSNVAKVWRYLSFIQSSQSPWKKRPWKPPSNLLLLMEEILHQMIGRLSHCLQGFIHPRWCRISSIDSTFTVWSPPSPVKRGMGQKWHPSTPLEDCWPTSREWPWGGDVVIRSLPTHRLHRNSLFKDQNEKYWKIFSNKFAILFVTVSGRVLHLFP